MSYSDARLMGIEYFRVLLGQSELHECKIIAGTVTESLVSSLGLFVFFDAVLGNSVKLFAY